MATLHVDLDAIRGNTAAVTALLHGAGLALVAVTKGCMGDPAVAGAMLAGGARALADSRDAALEGLRRAHPQAEIHRLHLPPVHGRFMPADLNYVSSVEGVAAVAEAAPGAAVMIDVETGDLREGVPEEQLEEVVASALAHKRLRLAGLSTNFACFAGHPEGLPVSVERISAAARRISPRFGLGDLRVSAGNSSLLSLLWGGGGLPAEVTEVRCGEALLLGQDPLTLRPLPGCRQDACLLRAEVLERYTKPSGGGPRAVLDLGTQDLGAGAVRFVRPGLTELGRSSDYLVVGSEAAGDGLSPGEVVTMIPSYYALVAAWTSPFVAVCTGGDTAPG